MAQYKTGTATFTNGSSTVTGSGTAWLSNLSAGDYIVRRGDSLNTYQAYQIGGINSNTSLTLTAPYGGSTASNVEYVAHVDFIDNDRPELSNGDIETAAIMNRWVTSVAQLTQLGTAATHDVGYNPEEIPTNAIADSLRVKNIASIADLPITGTTGQKVSVSSYHQGNFALAQPYKGGGDFAWGTGVHNGGTFIDPNRVFPTPAEWAAGPTDPTVIAWFDTSGGSVSGWARAKVAVTTPQIFGAIADNIADDTASIKAAISYESAGGAMHMPTGVYRTTETIYIPFGFSLTGDGLQPAANIGVLDPTIGTTINGVHTGPATISLKAAYACNLDNFTISGDATTTPQTGLCLGRGTAASAGRHTINDINVAGWFSKAAVYSIASEENLLTGLRVNVVGGLAPFAFFTSESDELSVDTLFTSSNFTMYVTEFNILHQADYTGLGISTFPIYISTGTSGSPDYTANLHFENGFTGAISQIADSRHIRVNLAGDAQNITFENVGCESFNSAAPPQSLLYVSGAGNTLRGLKFKSVTGGQFQAGQSHFIETQGGVVLDGADIDSPGADHKSEFSELNNSNVNILDQDIRIISGATSNQLRGRQVYLNEIAGSASINNITQSPTIGPLNLGNVNLADMSISTQTLFSGQVHRDMAVVIDGTGSPNTFKWSKAGLGVYDATGVAITGSPQLLTEGIYIQFANLTGHNIDELWQFTADPNIIMG